MMQRIEIQLDLEDLILFATITKNRTDPSLTFLTISLI